MGNLRSECKRNVEKKRGIEKKSKVLGHLCMNNNASKMIMACVSSICRAVEAAMINKMIRQILNSMGPVCVTHQIQLNKRNNCLSAKWNVAMSQCHAQLSFA